MKDRINNIQEQENNFDEINLFLDKMEVLLEEWGSVRNELMSLVGYYKSPQWMADYDASNEGEFKEIKCGILSQDAVYDLIYRHRQVFQDLRKMCDEADRVIAGSSIKPGFSIRNLDETKRNDTKQA